MKLKDLVKLNRPHPKEIRELCSKQALGSEKEIKNRLNRKRQALTKIPISNTRYVRLVRNNSFWLVAKIYINKELIDDWIEELGNLNKEKRL